MKGIKFILIIAILINIVLIAFMTFFVPSIHEYTYEEYRIAQEGEDPELEAALKIRILPVNRKSVEEQYKGNLELAYMYEKLFDLVHTNLPVLQKEIQGLNTNQLNQYLENNKNKLLVCAGITNIEQLLKLANAVNGLDIEDSQYIDTNIVENTYQTTEQYSSFEISINYNTCKLHFRVYVVNDVLTSPMVIFEALSGGEK